MKSQKRGTQNPETKQKIIKNKEIKIMKANIMCKVIEMTKVEAKKAGIVGTAEFD